MKTKIAYRFKNKQELDELVNLYGKYRFCYVPTEEDLNYSFSIGDEVEGHLYDAITDSNKMGTWTSGDPRPEEDYVIVELPEKWQSYDNGFTIYKDRVEIEDSQYTLTIKQLEEIIEISKQL